MKALSKREIVAALRATGGNGPCAVYAVPGALVAHGSGNGELDTVNARVYLGARVDVDAPALIHAGPMNARTAGALADSALAGMTVRGGVMRSGMTERAVVAAGPGAVTASLDACAMPDGMPAALAPSAAAWLLDACGPELGRTDLAGAWARDGELCATDRHTMHCVPWNVAGGVVPAAGLRILAAAHNSRPGVLTVAGWMWHVDIVAADGERVRVSGVCRSVRGPESAALWRHDASDVRLFTGGADFAALVKAAAGIVAPLSARERERAVLLFDPRGDRVHVLSDKHDALGTVVWHGFAGAVPLGLALPLVAGADLSAGADVLATVKDSVLAPYGNVRAVCADGRRVLIAPVRGGSRFADLCATDAAPVATVAVNA